MAAAAEPPEPGPRGLRRLARARPARLQLPARRHRRGDRPRAAREARRDPRGALDRRRALRASSSPTCPGSSSRAPTTPTTSARGSCTSSRFPRDADREAVIASLSASGRSDGALPPVHPPPAVHAGALRVPRRPLPRRRGDRVAHARAPVPRAARRGRSGVRRGRARAIPGRSVARPVSGRGPRHAGRCGASSPCA